MLKERVKSLALFLLFALSIYLMKELWASDLIMTLKNDSQTENTILDTAPVIAPKTIIYGFGSGTYSAVFFDKYGTWESLKIDLKSFLNADKKVEIVDQEIYENAKSLRSLELQFPYELTLGDLEEVLNQETNQKNEDNQRFNTLLIVSGKAKSIYLKGKDQYILLNGETRFDSVDPEIFEAEKNETTRYKTVEAIYKLKNILSTGEVRYDDNLQIVPIGAAEERSAITVAPEYNIRDDGVLRELVTQYFGTHIVKKLVDIDGSLVYLYGYGEKSLKVSQNGEIEFKSKIQNVPLKTISLHEALLLSINFMDRFGGIPEGLQLLNYEYTIQDEAPAYQLNFSLSLNHQKIDGETAVPGIQMTLIGGQVTEYKRYILLPVSELQRDTLASGVQTMDWLINSNFVSTLGPNYLNDHPELQNASLQEGSRNLLYHILQSINSFESLYYLNDTNYQALIPVWKIGFDQYLYYFDLNSGQVIKTERKAD